MSRVFKIIGGFTLMITAVSAMGMPGMADDTSADESVAETNAATATPALIITLSENNPRGIVYNSGDEAKTFLSFGLTASSTEDIMINRLDFLVTDSIASAYLNPGLGSNISNVSLYEVGGGGESGQAQPAVTGDSIYIFSGLDLNVPAGATRQFEVAADVTEGIADTVASKIDLVNVNAMDARGAESGLSAEIAGSAFGNYANLTLAVPKPDLTVTEITVYQDAGQGGLIPDKLTSIRVVYRNNGTGPVGEYFAKTIDLGGADVFEPANDGLPVSAEEQFLITPGVISPTESYTEVYAGAFRRTGPVRLSVGIDPDNEIDEINDRNNFLFSDINITSEISYPDFIVYDINLEPAVPEAGSNVRIDVTYKNIGSDFSGDVNEFFTRAYLGYIEGWFIFDDNRPRERSRPLPEISHPWLSGEILTESFWGKFTRAREITLEARIDPTGKVSELDEFNNKFEKTIVVREKGGSAMKTRLSGKIILRVEAAGEAYYIDPAQVTAYFLGRPRDAFAVMRERGIGITNADLTKIPIGLCRNEACLVSRTTDTDGDGLSDIFENTIGTDKDDPDSDHDGLNDSDELERGSDPTDGTNHDTVTDIVFAEKHKGRIFLQTEANGEAWYINPADARRYFLGRPVDAFAIMRGLGLGISENDFNSL